MSFFERKIIRHVNNIPTTQFFTRISRNNQSKSYMLSLTECVWEFGNNALWDTHEHALLFDSPKSQIYNNICSLHSFADM